MYTPYLRNLRVRLQERKDAVLRANMEYLESHLKTFLAFISTQPILSSITIELENLIPNSEQQELISKMNSGEYYQFHLPGEEQRRAAHLLVILKYFAGPSHDLELFNKMSGLFRSGEFDEMTREYSEQLFLPLYYYYDERIDESDLLLYLLLKHKRLCEWFDRDVLFKSVMENSGKREAILDLHLRRFLIQEGIDYPFSNPHSPSGRTDIVVHVEEKPLPLEIKLFDGESYGKSYLKQGFKQALRYAEDYHQSTGYLLVFNLSEKQLQIGENSNEDYFPKIETQNKTIFIITINIHPVTTPASKDKGAGIVIVAEEYLTSSAD